jgi:tetratricopeptide (TPR) repeat protein
MSSKLYCSFTKIYTAHRQTAKQRSGFFLHKTNTEPKVSLFLRGFFKTKQRRLGKQALYALMRTLAFQKKREKMAKRKQAAKDEVLIDVVEARGNFQDLVDNNRNLILGGLAVIVLVVGGWFAYNQFYKIPRQTEAIEQMYQAQVQFERDSFALALTNPGGGYIGFLDVIDNYKGTPAANLANYYAGICYLNLGQYEAAISYLKDFKAKGDVLPITKNGALGDAYAELNDLTQAMNYYQKAVNAGENDLLTPYYLKKVAMLHEKNGKPAEALKAYERIKKDYPNSADGRDIDKYIVRVTPKG